MLCPFNYNLWIIVLVITFPTEELNYFFIKLNITSNLGMYASPFCLVEEGIFYKKNNLNSHSSKNCFHQVWLKLANFEDKEFSKSEVFSLFSLKHGELERELVLCLNINATSLTKHALGQFCSQMTIWY